MVTTSPALLEEGYRSIGSIAPNGEIVAASEAYESIDACKIGIAMVKENASKAIIQDLAR